MKFPGTLVKVSGRSMRSSGLYYEVFGACRMSCHARVVHLYVVTEAGWRGHPNYEAFGEKSEAEPLDIS